MIKNCLISVSSKEGIIELARELKKFGVKIICTYGTAEILTKRDIQVKEVSETTGFQDLIDSRVKTIHPKIFAAILCDRDNETHIKQLKEMNIEPIDLVVVNFYPFESVASKENPDDSEAIENIDIGGVALLRAAAKNYKYVTAICDPKDYQGILEEIRTNKGSISEPTRKKLAVKAFRYTANYDSMISSYFEEKALFPSFLNLGYEKAMYLRYGENPHQKAALYKAHSQSTASVAFARMLGGKELSYNNILDLHSALELALDYGRPTCAIIKHTNPCAVASADKIKDASSKALAADPRSCYGGIIALNRRLEADLAEIIADKENFFEAIVATGIDERAVSILKGKTKWGANLRILDASQGQALESQIRSKPFVVRSISDGLLVQTRDDTSYADFKVITGNLSKEEERDLKFAWIVAKHAKSNAVVLAKDEQTVGIGQGQTSRVDTCVLAVQKAKKRAKGSVAASDAFFPFKDGVQVLIKAGVVAIIQPGGSIRDQEVTDLCKKEEVKLVFTKTRHFRH